MVFCPPSAQAADDEEVWKNYGVMLKKAATAKLSSGRPFLLVGGGEFGAFVRTHLSCHESAHSVVMHTASLFTEQRAENVTYVRALDAEKSAEDLETADSIPTFFQDVASGKLQGVSEDDKALDELDEDANDEPQANAEANGDELDEDNHEQEGDNKAQQEAEAEL